MRNPTRKEKHQYKFREQHQHGLGMDLDPKSGYEIKFDKLKNNLKTEADWEATLSGTKTTQYFSEEGHLGSLPLHDDYTEESEL